MRASVGDTILVHFLNRLADPVSVHPHGVFYNKSSEGALYNDGTSGSPLALLEGFLREQNRVTLVSRDNRHHSGKAGLR